MLPAWLEHPDPSIYLSNNYCVLDFETTNKDKGDPRNKENSIVLSSYKVGIDHEEYSGLPVVVHGNQFHQDRLLRAIEKSDFIIAHFAKFELQWLTRCGTKLHEVLPYDTLLGRYVQDGNKRSPRDLDSIAGSYQLGCKNKAVSLMIRGGICPSKIPKRMLQKYCVKDVVLTEQIFLRQRQELLEQDLLAVAFTRNIFTPVLADLEMNGMQLDTQDVYNYYEEYSKHQAKILHELQAFSKGINWNSRQQVATFVYGELGFDELKNRGVPIRNKPTKSFPDGVPKVAREVLLQLPAKTVAQRRFKDLYSRHNKIEKSIGTYLNLFKTACDTAKGMIYGTMNQAVTQTHRLSSSQPNLQNFDRNFKRLFTSRYRDKGWVVGERDAAQLEFRVAAWYGKDNQAYSDIANKYDVHRFTASVIGIARTPAKAHTFKPLFGGISGTIKEKAYYKAFKLKYHEITSEQDTWVNEVLLTKEQILPTGLKFYWPNIKLTKSGYIDGNTNVRNYPIQTLATAEIIPIGVTYVWHHMKEQELESLIVNTVHDSIITDENPEETNQITEITSKAFKTEVPEYLQTVYNINFDLPLDIETETGTNWADYGLTYVEK